MSPALELSPDAFVGWTVEALVRVLDYHSHHEGPQARREASQAAHGGPPGAMRIPRLATDLRALAPRTGDAALPEAGGPQARGRRQRRRRATAQVKSRRGRDGAGGSRSEATAACEHPAAPRRRGATEGRDDAGARRKHVLGAEPSDPRLQCATSGAAP